jgi:NAD(P) transhydrogenase subunit beta
MNWRIELTYLLSAFLFAIGLKMMSSPATARRGNLLSAVGMLITTVATLAHQGIVDYKWIAVGLALGSAIGTLAALRVTMTSMPEMVALFNGFGGLASLLVGWEEYHRKLELETFTATSIVLTLIIGGVTFTGSMMAWAKLKEIGLGAMKLGKAILFPGQQVVNSGLLLASVIGGGVFCLNPPESYSVMLLLILLSFTIGLLAVLPIGGADMPVVISLLNSYSGLAACTAGFVIVNNILIVAGALVGASGIILTNIMCKAMNRSLSNVLFSGFGSATAKTGRVSEGEVKPVSAEDAYLIMEAAESVLFVPGYGLAVAQAQHTVRELGELLQSNGCEVLYAIHPVAGRMPGHMNVLLAEANVPYDQLVEMETVNPTMESVDVCVVIGANDVVNPAARDDESSPIYGMPIIEADRARTVIVLKRSMASGFAGIDNPLFYRDNTRMLFGDAKASIQELVGQFKRS